MIRVAVVMGGPSAEHEVSLASGREILRHIDRSRYAVQALVISRDCLFYTSSCSVTVPDIADLTDPSLSPLFSAPLSPAAAGPFWENVDIALLTLHGTLGEDGRFQGYLDTVGIPYTGSGVLSSALCMNKIMAKQVFLQAGVPTPPARVWKRTDGAAELDAIAAALGFPCFVKCPQSGSSRLLGRAANRAELESTVGELSVHAPVLLIEAAITGAEYSCAVLEYPDHTLRALPPILIRPRSGTWFDYHAKYDAGASEEIVPAPCSQEITARIQDLALKTHRACWCRGISRTDMIDDGSEIHVLEINTLPGMTTTSLVPKAFAATGGTFSGLLDILITSAGTLTGE